MVGSTVGLVVTLLVRSGRSPVSGGVVDVVVCIVVSGTSEGTACEEEGEEERRREGEEERRRGGEKERRRGGEEGEEERRRGGEEERRVGKKEK